MSRIGLDFDGVIANCVQLKIEIARTMFGVSIPPEDFKKEIVTGKGLLTLDQYRSVQHEVYGNPDTALRAEVVPGAKEHILNLQADHDIHIVTSRTGHFADIAREWLCHHEIDLPITEVPYENTKQEGASGSAVFVDDDINKLRELIGHVPHLFLFDWPYNRSDVPRDGIERVLGWDNLAAAISRVVS